MDDKNIIERSIDYILDIEGRVLHHDPNDPGGMTLCGISRVHFPNLPVWTTVDRLLEKGVDSKVIVEMVMSHVIAFYTDMWNKYQLSLFDPRIAFEMFDQIINPGPAIMVLNIQRTINALNYNKRIIEDDLVIDGKYGKYTRNGILEAQKKGYTNEIVYVMNALQLYYYLTRTESNPNQKKYFVGWIKNRCIIK